MRLIGYSTGAIALGDFRRALAELSTHETQAVELSALRISEIRPLIDALPSLDLSRYNYVSMHLPSAFSSEEEQELISLLHQVPSEWILVIHPDAFHDHSSWLPLSDRLALENMDRRKVKGRTVGELQQCFDKLPNAHFCFDIGHARQFDPSMAEAYLILTAFANRLVQVHVSEVDAQSRHAVVTYAAQLAFKEVAHLIPHHIPLILESRVSFMDIEPEIRKVGNVFSRVPHS